MKPKAVDDRYVYWNKPPPRLSPRCVWWANRMLQGWRPNRRIRIMGYDSSAQWYGVYIWEYIHILARLCREPYVNAVLVEIVRYEIAGDARGIYCDYMFKHVNSGTTFWLRNRADVLDIHAKYWFTEPDKLEPAG